MARPTILVLASHNKGKTKEIKSLLSDFPVEIRDLNQFGPIPAIVEDGTTFDENAYKKASLTARYLGLPALADDSGLMVEALNGAPGVFSARYAGPDATDEQRCRKLLKELGESEQRDASFECVLSIAVPSGPALTYEGRCNGRISRQPMGSNGFGYDPVFFYPPLNKTFAQLRLEQKNQVSHRGKALQELRSEFDKVLIWIKQQMAAADPVGCMEGKHAG